MSIRVQTNDFGGSSLARIAVERGTSSWFVQRPSNADGWKGRAELVRSSLISSDWLGAIAPAFDATGPAAERLMRAGERGIAVTTGQQPGLFGGPLYTWWKALSALSLADRLETLTGLPVVPVFWAATDDADFAEASQTVVASENGAELIEMRPGSQPGTPLSAVPVGDLAEQLAILQGAAGSGSSAAIMDIVRSAYSQGETVGGAYVRMLRNVLSPLGIAVLDASHPAVRTAAFPLLRRAIQNSAEIESALSDRSREIEAAGHRVQVRQVAGKSLVFSETAGVRDRVRIRDADDLLRTAGKDSLGPNVLLRPVVERALIPTVAYVGGPAEVAYFAQTTAVAEALGEVAPLVVPRWSGTVIEPRVERILIRRGLSVEDFRDPHAIETRIARASIPESLQSALIQLEHAVDEAATRLTIADDEEELVPPSVVAGLRRNVMHRVERLERRYAASIKRRGNEALHDVEVARASLFPLGKAQERTLNAVPLLARYGAALITAVTVETERHAATLVQ